MQLRDAGKLALDDPLDRHIPGRRSLAVAPVPAQSRLRPAARAARADLGDAERSPRGRSWSAGSRRASRCWRRAPTGITRTSASRCSGEVVARVAGMEYERYVDERVLRPLGLSRTTWRPEPPVATGYFVDPWTDTAAREPVAEGRATASAGELWSTAPDLCRWAAFLADPDRGGARAGHRRGDARLPDDDRPRALDARPRAGADADAEGRPDLLRPQRRASRLPLERRLPPPDPDRRGGRHQLERGRRDHRARRGAGGRRRRGVPGRPARSGVPGEPPPDGARRRARPRGGPRATSTSSAIGTAAWRRCSATSPRPGADALRARGRRPLPRHRRARARRAARDRPRRRVARSSGSSSRATRSRAGRSRWRSRA